MRRTILIISILSAALGGVCGADQPKRRAPSGFTGVRGKKSIPDSAYSDTSQTGDQSEGNAAALDSGNGAIDKRAPSGFMGMRGKKPFPDPDDEYPEEGLIKRAPSGFLGMRGKKDMELDSFGGDDYDKRAPSGFLGMRGKKDYDEAYDSAYVEDKRAPSGFMGMRGKKAYEAFAEEIKRAQMSGFFGMRGKKQPSRSGFFGMRGKKYPYEFRGKFVGVRGKKSSNEIDDYGYLNGNVGNEQLSRLAEGLDLNQLMLLLTESNDGSWDNGNGYEGQDRV